MAKKITALPAKTAEINYRDLFEVAEYQSPGVYISKKVAFDAWKDQAFSTSNFSQNTGTFTGINTGYQSRYKVIGKTMYWSFRSACQLSVGCNTPSVKIPGGYSAKNYDALLNGYLESEPNNSLTICGAIGANYVGLQATVTPYSAGTTYLNFSISFEIL